MTDPIETLEALPPESPPREAVLASLRLFRYRAFATVLTVAVAVLGLALVARSAAVSGLNEDVRSVLEHDGVEYRAVSGSTTIGAVSVSVTEIATSPAGNAVRVVFVDTGTPERVVDLDVLAVRQGSAELGPHLSIQSLGRDAGRNSTAVWVPLDQFEDPIGAEIEFLVLPIPDSVLEEGGELTSDDGFIGVVTIERNPRP